MSTIVILLIALAADAIEGIGAHAVMIADESALTDRDGGDAPLAEPGSNVDVMGNTVMSADGSALGTVVDVVIETGVDPEVVGCEVETDSGSVFVPISAQMGLSGENLVVPASATDFISNDLVGFGASVRTFRERLSTRPIRSDLMTTRTIVATLDRNVIAIDTAESIGSVSSFVVSPTVDRIDKVHIGGRRKHAIFTDWADIQSFGDDAVMVASADAPSESDDERDIDTAKGSLDIIGTRILDTAGFEHGVVTDVGFDDSSGDIVFITNGETDLVATAVHSLDTYAVVDR